jgi:hypothetical protein
VGFGPALSFVGFFVGFAVFLREDFFVKSFVSS